MGGIVLPVLHLIQMFITLYNDGSIPEDHTTDYPEAKNYQNVATLMLARGEVMFLVLCGLLNYIFLERLEIFKFLFNQLLNYNKKLSGTQSITLLKEKS